MLRMTDEDWRSDSAVAEDSRQLTYSHSVNLKNNSLHVAKLATSTHVLVNGPEFCYDLLCHATSEYIHAAA